MVSAGQIPTAKPLGPAAGGVAPLLLQYVLLCEILTSLLAANAAVFFLSCFGEGDIKMLCRQESARLLEMQN